MVLVFLFRFDMEWGTLEASPWYPSGLFVVPGMGVALSEDVVNTGQC